MGWDVEVFSTSNIEVNGVLADAAQTVFQSMNGIRADIVGTVNRQQDRGASPIDSQFKLSKQNVYSVLKWFEAGKGIRVFAIHLVISLELDGYRTNFRRFDIPISPITAAAASDDRCTPSDWSYERASST